MDDDDSGSRNILSEQDFPMLNERSALKRGRTEMDLVQMDSVSTIPTEDIQMQERKSTKVSYRSKLTEDLPNMNATMEEEGELWDDTDSDDDQWEEDGIGPAIKLTREDKTRMRKPWRRTLIVKLLGRSISYTHLCNRVRQLWAINGSFDAVDLENGFYCFKFSRRSDYDHVLTEGPWIIADHYLTVRRWSPYFVAEEAPVTSVAAWIRFPSMPLEFYDMDCLKRMGNKIGRTVKIDKNTTVASRGKFARLCVEIDLSKPLTPKIFMGGRWQKVEYEGLKMLCFKCGKFGHITEQCTPTHKANDDKHEQNCVGVKGLRESGREFEKEEFGPWMLAKKSYRRQRVSRQDRPGKPEL